MVFYNSSIRWWSERLDDLSSRTITREHSQEWTWQAWLWAHNLVSSKLVASQIATLQQPPPPAGGGSQIGAQESPSMSNVELEYDIIPPDKGKGKAGHDPPREQETMSHLKRWDKSDDHLQSHSVRHHLTTRSDNEEIWDGITSEINKVAKCLDEITAKVIRRAEEGHIEMQV